MTLSAKWQKFYKWYCIVSCLLVAVVILLSGIGGTGWGIRNEGFYMAALRLSRILGLATLFGADLLLWLISLVVWRCRRESSRCSKIFGWGVLMMLVKFWNLVWLAMLNGA